ncbi:26S proteasome non-ATPase regulatory subunit like protein [Argiope bruennichi]|uniref:26S proteasome non-ATPase regulatory subunit like protein n=1 Tax=Argiope bruennichi TaxID=94029 RepID=A0A8T0EVS1_ARGBR|nr:26S proteasome non-ATPase regulatory subunit like protein [Argiope bruennichi]
MAVQEVDVEMTIEDGENTSEKEKIPKADVEALSLADIKEHLMFIEKSVSSKEPRFILRVVRSLVSVRKRLSAKILRKVVTHFYVHSTQQRDTLLNFIDEPMDMDTNGNKAPARVKNAKSSQQPLLPEQDIYIHLLVLLYLIDCGQPQMAVDCADMLMKKVVAQPQRTVDLIAAKCYFYLSRSYELLGCLSNIRSFLHSRLRSAVLRNDYEGQAVLLNCLLRNYLHYNLYEQASKLASKSVFPEMASDNEWARFLYYLGRIKAIQLDYSEAHKNLLQAIRKAPELSAVGFRQTVYKLAITVELLLGDIPDRSLFRQPQLRKSLAPYYQLTQVLENLGPQFQKDHTYTLILRLRHNVIKTGIRMISLSYSRISLAEIARKLLLGSSEDAEFIVAKAIRDGVIEATINHAQGYMQSKQTVDVYSTGEPLAAFHKRISFCLDIHNKSVKTMRFPPKSFHKDLETAEERREREKQDIEYAKEMTDDVR